MKRGYGEPDKIHELYRDFLTEMSDDSQFGVFKNKKQKIIRRDVMLFRMACYLFMMGSGIALGRSGKVSKRLMERLDKFQLLCLLFLLFVMGINVGTNQEIMDSFGNIGKESALFALFTIGFSVLFVFLFNKIYGQFQKGKVR